MSLCASCGLTVPDDTAAALCLYHLVGDDDEWSVTNRIMCDFFHRGKSPVRLAPTDRIEVAAVGDLG